MNIVRKLKISELFMLTVLFEYKDVNEMNDENTRDIENGTIDISLCLMG